LGAAPVIERVDLHVDVSIFYASTVYDNC